MKERRERFRFPQLRYLKERGRPFLERKGIPERGKELKVKTFLFHTLGCKVNQYESEAMEELFLQKGYQPAQTEEACDVFVINTCSVTHISDAKSRKMIRRLKKKNPAAVVCVVGCYAQLAPEKLLAMDGVDVVIGTKGRSFLVDAVEEFMETGEKIVRVPNLEEVRAYDPLTIHTELSNTRAALKIQEGCDMYCSYCIIPHARGHIASRPLSSLLEEAKGLSQRGFQEIVLTGIHVASYGKEGKEGLDLIDVVESLAMIRGIQRIRLSSIEPRWVTAEKLKRLKDTGKFCDHFHLSLQSGSDRVLKRMNRKYDTLVYKEKIDQIREVFPDAGLTTDVIVGFPGEEEEDFQRTLNFVREIGFLKVHVFPYSRREGTPAADFACQVSPEIKKERARRLGALERELAEAFLKDQLGKKARVLFESEKRGPFLEGYTTNYIRVRLPRHFHVENQIVEGRLAPGSGRMLSLNL